ncbi:Proteasome subunit alpha type7-like protein [Nosema bombycis CQ1]|uniref:Proteasome subunit alpha type7-like protein n=1 Tax=Nosema bombycis (strain CQ1 / CVCC 102059) TaxID=578461 RepID=R0KS36_NOSB1|nr:Proteasome subunit alpha type7-like protein [Nosema bombycis CQ1]|eukprot:EOB13022.1 Proteasome subunit alpha type7-like protein [Nosema bombycis CQ1]
MSNNELYYKVFNSDGKIIQVEYGLEAVNNSLPIVILKNKNTIVCAAKKGITSKLDDEIHSCISQIYDNLYSAFTGFPADINYINMVSLNIASSQSYKFGFPITPDIIARDVADRMQKLLQSTGERSPAFGGAFFGFDGESPIISKTDMTGIVYRSYGVAVGEKHHKMIKYIEGHYNINISDQELYEIAAGALLESIGEDSGWQELEIAVLKKDGKLFYFNDSEIEKLLQSIAEK